MAEKPSLRARALHYLSRRELSRTALARKLAPFAESQEELESLLEDLAMRHWQSDERYVEQYVANHRQKYGNRRLAASLSQQGIKSELIKSHQVNAQEEIANALSVMKKKYASRPQTTEEKQKMMRFMAYRGFDFETIRNAYLQWKADEE